MCRPKRALRGPAPIPRRCRIKHKGAMRAVIGQHTWHTVRRACQKVSNVALLRRPSLNLPPKNSMPSRAKVKTDINRTNSSDKTERMESAKARNKLLNERLYLRNARKPSTTRSITTKLKRKKKNNK